MDAQVLTKRTVEPKFPTPVNLSFLLRLDSFQSTVQDIVGDHECDKAKEMALTTLKVRCFCFVVISILLILEFSEYGQWRYPRSDWPWFC